jgi:hypothetical protein
MIPQRVRPGAWGIIPMEPGQSGPDGLRPCWTAQTAMRVRERRASPTIAVNGTGRWQAHRPFGLSESGAAATSNRVSTRGRASHDIGRP